MADRCFAMVLLSVCRCQYFWLLLFVESLSNVQPYVSSLTITRIKTTTKSKNAANFLLYLSQRPKKYHNKNDTHNQDPTFVPSNSNLDKMLINNDSMNNMNSAKSRRTLLRSTGRMIFTVSCSTISSLAWNRHPASDAAEVFPLLLGTRLSEQSANGMAVEGSSSSSSNSLFPIGLLESRVTENILAPPPYGMESSDIVYPSWFQGVWDVQSKTIDIQAPCGVAFFGGNSTYQKAYQEVGTTLHYSSRFLPVGTSSNRPTESNNEDTTMTATWLRQYDCIADREYNVVSIAKAAMGPNSVVDIPFVSPNKLTVFVAPIGSPSILKVELLTLLRRQETISNVEFHCSEVVREIISPASSSASSLGEPTPIPPQQISVSSGTAASVTLFKEIETTSLYRYDPIKDAITCQQRSASFLLPSQQSMTALKIWEAARGRPVDVRFYNVTYTRRT